MEPNEVRLQINLIKGIADMALEACRRDDEVPQSLHESVAALDMDVNSALQAVQRTDDLSSIVQRVDDLEASADRAKQATKRAYRISEHTRNAVLRAHDEIARLKRQLH